MDNNESHENGAIQENGGQASSKNAKGIERKAWLCVTEALGGLEADAQSRVLKSVMTFLELDFNGASHMAAPMTSDSQEGSYSEDRRMSAKEFLLDKRPSSDVERITCLAYYLTHHRNTPYFKTLDLSKLNTESAQIKLSNAAQATENATKSGFLAPATQGNKQITSIGEIYVQKLPDKQAARTAIEGLRSKSRHKKSTQSKQNVNQHE